MLDNIYQRGFRPDVGITDYRILQDANGFYIKSLVEGTDVYLNDFYVFLEKMYPKCLKEIETINIKLSTTDEVNKVETAGYLRARLIIVKRVLKAVVQFYTDTNVGAIVNPWCFGTIVLEKIEVYIGQIKTTSVDDPDVGAFPYYVIKYLEEAYKPILLDLFDFPSEAFAARWQYMELLKRYSGILKNITSSLNNVLQSIKDIDDKSKDSGPSTTPPNNWGW